MVQLLSILLLLVVAVVDNLHQQLLVVRVVVVVDLELHPDFQYHQVLIQFLLVAAALVVDLLEQMV
jgi:hypothetical protein